MSGGIAYVRRTYPPTGSTPRWSTSTRSTARTRAFLRNTVEAHAPRPVAGRRAAADRLGRGLARFGKVMPKDYKRVLRATMAAEQEARDVNEAVMAASHG